jgi:alpha-ketoglutarate-dependent taurine dioxygenase
MAARARRVGASPARKAGIIVTQTLTAAATVDVRQLAGNIGAGRAERADPAAEQRRQEFVSRIYQTEHPAVRVHPETGERSLVLGGFAAAVPGFSPQAGRDLIRVLQEYVTRPEHTVRWQWRVGDLAIWDNRATQHYAIFDYGTEHRRGERVAGPVPVGIDGRLSVALQGEAAHYYAGAAD